MCANLVLPDGQTITSVGELREFIGGVEPAALAAIGADQEDNNCLCCVDINYILAGVGLRSRCTGLDDEAGATERFPRAYYAVGGMRDGEVFTREWGTEPMETIKVGQGITGSEHGWDVAEYRLEGNIYVVAGEAAGDDWVTAQENLAAVLAAGN